MNMDRCYAEVIDSVGHIPFPRNLQAKPRKKKDATRLIGRCKPLGRSQLAIHARKNVHLYRVPAWASTMKHQAGQ